MEEDYAASGYKAPIDVAAELGDVAMLETS